MTQRPASLGYASPRIYLDAKFDYRTSGAVYGAIVIVLFAIVLIVIAWKDRGMLYDTGWRLVIGLAGVALLGFAAKIGYGHINHRVDSIQITDDGVVRNGKVLTWQNIARVNGVMSKGNVDIYFTKRHFLNLFPGMIVCTTPALTVGQYEDFARMLICYVMPRHPHLNVNPVPQEASS